jgi:DNA-binding MarR family transcriptional regulator
MTHALRKELKQTKAFSKPEVAVYVGLQLTSDALRAPVARLFKDHGLSEPQYNVLRILRGATEPLPCLEVASRMVTRLPDITRLVDRLVDADLARRKRCTEDRRVVHLTITDAGLALLEELDAPLEALHRELLGHLTRKQLSQLGELLDRARETVARSHD